ncbi:hypothetical protein SAMN04488543_0707 [Friedmanniella luteola]|uniref:Uncharacterized protein n=1 Tax=Friedmanniella luteola TaxID=546871 RepID=A0A1H1MUV5_9ACTN|nr:hypothetical protein SAMN04488543_0707 [Friedmanniella luteola]
MKSLIPGGRPVPALLAATSPDELLRLRLSRQGWVPFGRALQPGAVGEVRVGVDRVQVLANGRLVLDDSTNAVSPPGWWAAVDDLGGHCVVVVVREGAADLTGPDASDQLVALLGADQAISAALPVVTDLVDREPTAPPR